MAKSTVKVVIKRAQPGTSSGDRFARITEYTMAHADIALDELLEETKEFEASLDEVFDVEAALKAMKSNGGKFYAHAAIKDVDEEKDGTMVLRGFSNTRNIDRVRDIVEPTAFTRSLRRNIRRLKILDMHDHSKPIGLGRRGEVREKGMFLEAGIPDLDLEHVQRVRTEITAGLKDSFSIGFIPIKSEFIAKDDRPKQNGVEADRRITDLDLLEVSVVTIPANTQSTFSVAKAVAHGTDVRGDEGYLSLDQLSIGSPASDANYNRTIQFVNSIAERTKASGGGVDKAIEAVLDLTNLIKRG